MAEFNPKINHLAGDMYEMEHRSEERKICFAPNLKRKVHRLCSTSKHGVLDDL
jgi:hypothetical protein